MINQSRALEVLYNQKLREQDKIVGAKEQ